MLFNSTSGLESEKERNFYSKVFGGYFFNELIPGYESRLEDFTSLLKNSRDRTFSGSLDEHFRLSKGGTHVTFDFHGYLLDEGNDRGELADILIADIENNSVVAIEVKFLSNWDFKKDIENASRRFESLLQNKRISFAHVLLVTQTKLNSVQQASSARGSNWANLVHAELKYPLVVLTWEDIAEVCRNRGGDIVGEFIEHHLGKSRKRFREHARELIGRT